MCEICVGVMLHVVTTFHAPPAASTAARAISKSGLSASGMPMMPSKFKVSEMSRGFVSHISAPTRMSRFKIGAIDGPSSAADIARVWADGTDRATQSESPSAAEPQRLAVALRMRCWT